MNGINEPMPMVKRKLNLFYSDISRVITRVNMPGGPDRVMRVCDRILRLSPSQATKTYQGILESFDTRHRNLSDTFKRNYYVALQNLPSGTPLDVNNLTEDHKLLMGAYFTKEYSIEAAAFFNPSIIPHPEQSGLPEGSVRIIISFRAVGEGHLSSIVFRTGVVGADLELTFDPVSQYVEAPEVVRNPDYDKHTFSLKLHELGVDTEICNAIMSDLNEQFTFKDLEDAIWIFGVHNPQQSQHQTVNTVKWLAKANYQLKFSADQDISERVIFPYSDNESRGIEDARFCKFTDEDGEITYYATYTAYNGYTILPQMLETKDFLNFNIITLNGDAAKNKGMALFPRRLNGKYYMIGRIDGENLYIMSSDNMHFWHKANLLLRPRYDWDLMTIGNCGSPIETPDGWLLLTHGVGPMRTYSIGAVLLDLEDPSIVRAYMEEPLIMPTGREREGYVPNVVYTCGVMAHDDALLIPYAMSDSVSGFATVQLSSLLERLRSCRR